MSFVIFDMIEMVNGDIWTIDIITDADANIIVFDEIKDAEKWMKERPGGDATCRIVELKDAREND